MVLDVDTVRRASQSDAGSLRSQVGPTATAPIGAVQVEAAEKGREMGKNG